MLRLLSYSSKTVHRAWFSCTVVTSDSIGYGQQARKLCTSGADGDGAEYSTHTQPMNVFNRNIKWLQRERAAKAKDANVYDYLKDEVGYRLTARILDICREFKDGLDLGCGRGHVAKHLSDAYLKNLTMVDMSPGMMSSAEVPDSPGLFVTRQCVDEERRLPFSDDSFDIVLSNLSLHWVNNLPGCLRELHRTLREGGVFLASVFGGDTLYELRSSLLLAEMERKGGVSPHVSPFTEAQDLSALLTQAGFEMVTIDTDDIKVGFPSLFELLHDLQGMGESSASVTLAPHLSRDSLMAAAALYQEIYGDENGIPATFKIIYMIGWKPDPNQVVKPAERGSATVSLKDLGKLQKLAREQGLKGKLQFMEELTNEPKDK